MKSGMLAAEAAFEELSGSSADSMTPVDLSAYEESLKASWVWEELEKERNIRPSYVIRHTTPRAGSKTNHLYQLAQFLTMVLTG